MKKALGTFALLLLAASFCPAQLGQGHATGSDFVIVDTPVSWWSLWTPFRIQNRGPNTVQLKRIYTSGIKSCTYDDAGQHCNLGDRFQIHTSCGAAQGGKFVLPTYLLPTQGCDTWFVWMPNKLGYNLPWLINFEAVDTVTGQDVSLVAVTIGKGCVAPSMNC